MKLRNKHVFVYGLGESGRSVIKLLREKGAYVSFYDDNVDFYDYVGFERNPFEKKFDFVVLSPGVKCRANKILEDFDRRKIPVLSELDFGFLFCKGKIIAITGTNGKTTTCMLTHKILRSAGYDSVLCGNIGLPFSAVATRTTRRSVVVCEVSSFQLEKSRIFRANIGCVLNIKPDHIDRHGSFEEYRNAKAKICNNMKSKDLLLLNLDDEESKYMVFHKNFEYFSKRKLKSGTYIKDGAIFHNKINLASVNCINLPGEKNLENVLASVAICSHLKVKKEIIEKAISSFCPASHRMEVVGVVKGATFVDDSKATNVASTLACLEAFKGHDITLLLGGMGKEISYDDIFQCGVQISKVVCFGSEGQAIEDCAKKHSCDVVFIKKFEDACKFCIENCVEKEFVLLSPACSSFDEFSSYAERGDKFKEIVLGYVNE